MYLRESRLHLQLWSRHPCPSLLGLPHLTSLSLDHAKESAKVSPNFFLSLPRHNIKRFMRLGLWTYLVNHPKLFCFCSIHVIWSLHHVGYIFYRLVKEIRKFLIVLVVFPWKSYLWLRLMHRTYISCVLGQKFYKNIPICYYLQKISRSALEFRMWLKL